MRLLRVSAVVVMAMMLAGCVSTDATQLGSGAQHPALTAAQVNIYRTADMVPGKYEEVALLTSSGSSLNTSEAQMYESMKKKAAALGANGIILDAISEPSAGAKVAAAVLGVGANRQGKAVAIYVYPGGR